MSRDLDSVRIKAKFPTSAGYTTNDFSTVPVLQAENLKLEGDNFVVQDNFRKQLYKSIAAFVETPVVVRKDTGMVFITSHTLTMQQARDFLATRHYKTPMISNWTDADGRISMFEKQGDPTRLV